ncbi:hypothetical protein GFS24_11460 [Chitinophaga sp. SYP-B3965]|uniref:nuclear transport factor 2 family protein n=1 Tax=Chitinophaga sp. SYP-B3965 TaxID=2663120 RepID=UPI0012995957|nr:nuclear transport factor 2 family protein [Chitinophaga sp. SYP-B3965]MRG45737.1 hypothetical protein [Chitinophaga sp. SYP-B3965]
MKTLTFFLLMCLSLSTHAQKNTKIMNTEKLTNLTVRKAIEALNAGDSKAWFALFTPNAELFDDGNKMNFKQFFEKALGHERFTSIDKVENKSLDVYGKFHSDQWGDFKTYFKFHIDTSGKISRLDIGQASY